MSVSNVLAVFDAMGGVSGPARVWLRQESGRANVEKRCREGRDREGWGTRRLCWSAAAGRRRGAGRLAHFYAQYGWRKSLFFQGL